MHPSLVSENVRSFKRRGRSEADAVREAIAAAGQVDQSAGLQPPIGKIPLPKPGDGRITDPPVSLPIGAAGSLLPNQPPDIPGVGGMTPHPGAPPMPGPTVKPGMPPFLPTDTPREIVPGPPSPAAGVAGTIGAAGAIGGAASSSPLEEMLLRRSIGGLRPAVQPTRRMI